MVYTRPDSFDEIAERVNLSLVKGRLMKHLDLLDLAVKDLEAIAAKAASHITTAAAAPDSILAEAESALETYVARVSAVVKVLAGVIAPPTPPVAPAPAPTVASTAGEAAVASALVPPSPSASPAAPAPSGAGSTADPTVTIQPVLNI